MRILILCTGNSCRSQMAEGFLQSMDERLEVFSAGTFPARVVHPMAIQVMQEAGVDISGHTSKSMDVFLNQAFDFVITVCDDARESCPAFSGKVGHYLHMGFEDPSTAEGSEAFVLSEFRRVRDEIKEEFGDFYHQTLQNEL